jgi:hypothetical protein
LDEGLLVVDIKNIAAKGIYLKKLTDLSVAFILSLSGLYQARVIFSWGKHVYVFESGDEFASLRETWRPWSDL